MVKEKGTVAKKSNKKVSMKAVPVTKNKTTTKSVTTSVKAPVKKKVPVVNGSNAHPLEIHKVVHKALPRYSDAKLEEFKKILEEKEKKQRAELASVNDSLNSNNDHGGFSEDGSAVSNEKEQLNQLKARIIQTLGHIENAYARIRNKTYGRCKTTNELIDEARLRVHPWATQSIHAKLETKKAS